MIKALRGARRDELIELTRRHLKPSPEAYIRAYERRFGKAEPAKKDVSLLRAADEPDPRLGPAVRLR